MVDDLSRRSVKKGFAGSIPHKHPRKLRSTILIKDFGVLADKLKAAVQKVGHSAQAVEQELKG